MGKRGPNATFNLIMYSVYRQDGGCVQLVETGARIRESDTSLQKGQKNEWNQTTGGVGLPARAN